MAQKSRIMPIGIYILLGCQGLLVVLITYGYSSNIIEGLKPKVVLYPLVLPDALILIGLWAIFGIGATKAIFFLKKEKYWSALITSLILPVLFILWHNVMLSIDFCSLIFGNGQCP